MSSPRPRHRGFTLIEVLVAGLVAAFVLGAVSVSLGQLAQAKNRTGRRLEAYLRADAALTALRRDLVSTLRRADLFYTRFLLTDDAISTPLGQVDRDEILVFTTQLRTIRDLDFIGEGLEFETQYRVQTDRYGPALWRRQDPAPDEYPRGGGVATPVAAGVVGLALQAYDGELWHDQWDSDFDGLPHAVRVTVTASGHHEEEDPYDAPLATLRTIVPIERVPLPAELPEPELETGEDGEDQTEAETPEGAPGVPELPGGAGRDGRGGVQPRGGGGGRGGARPGGGGRPNGGLRGGRRTPGSRGGAPETGTGGT